jgi:transcriptional regulator with XRE-family HTH domain
LNRINAPTTQRRQLIDFLKGCRARLTPTQVGLPDTNRRRTPGLRREDVAALAGVSVTWYTWLEQGRDIQVSADVLERMLDALAVPAIVLTARWDVIGWNQIALKVIRDYSALPPGHRNLLRVLLVEDEAYRQNPELYEATARRLLAKFRVDYSQAPGDAGFEELIADLSASCPIFDRLWARGHRHASARSGVHVRALVVRAGRQPQAAADHLHAMQRSERCESERGHCRDQAERPPLDAAELTASARRARSLG